jgi:diaminopimelate decarboxylase
MTISTNNRIPLFPITASVNQSGRLEIAGSDVVKLVETHGTPLYLYDAATIKNHVTSLQELLKKYYGDNFMVAYATKAYFSYALAKKLAPLGIGEDIVSVGDIWVRSERHPSSWE